jgi:hypothetical protein
MTGRLFVVMTVALTVWGGQVLAHHSHASTYFEGRRMTIEGEIVQVSIRNPHSWVHVGVKDPASGEVKIWAIEWAAGSQLNRGGVNGRTLRVGDHVTVVASPARNPDQLRMLMQVIQRPADNWTWGTRAGEAVD